MTTRPTPPVDGRGRRFRRILSRAILAGIASCLAFPLAEGLLDATHPVPIDRLDRFGESLRVEAADGRWLRVAPTPGGERRLPVPLEELSPHVLDAVVASEDRRFFHHGGVDALAVFRAAATSIARGRVVSGASTLTMQLARIAEPRPRDLRGKIREMIRARQIERRLSKEAILEAYLDSVPWGGTLRGIEAASRYWCGKRARDLAPEEAAMLVAMLPAPSRLAPDRAAPELRRRRDVVLARMREEGLLVAAELRRAVSAPIRARRHLWPFRAPHLCDGVARGAAGSRIETSIDLDLQDRLETIVRSEETAGVDGVAVVVVERGTGAIVALIGSRDYRSRPLDAASCRRSAGSTLKPFLYGLALEELVTGMDGLLLDTQGSFGDWRPRNFDERFEGRIRAADALADSRNLPAVRLLEAVGTDRFRDLLVRIGIEAPEDVGLDSALGTVAVSPVELARAYAAFFEPGRSADRVERGRSRVLEAMGGRPPARGIPAGRIAWKTGTSSGRRDAWSVGVTSRHVVVVWVGDLRGRAHPDLVGSRAASRLLAACADAVGGLE